MPDVVIQLGHCYRKRGATGTSGHGHTEQEFVAKVGHDMVDALILRGYTARAMLADERPTRPCALFIALHQDGSANPAVRGASVGYPTDSRRADSARAAGIWKARYSQAGFPSGFRPDNYSAGLRRFYMWRPGRVPGPAAYLIEHGFATNAHDQNWMWGHLPQIVAANVRAAADFLGPRQAPPNIFDDGDEEMKYVSDPATNDVWLIGPGWHRDVSSAPTGAKVETVSGLVQYILPDLEAGGVSVDVTDARNG